MIGAGREIWPASMMSTFGDSGRCFEVCGLAPGHYISSHVKIHESREYKRMGSAQTTTTSQPPGVCLHLPDNGIFRSTTTPNIQISFRNNSAQNIQNNIAYTAIIMSYNPRMSIAPRASAQTNQRTRQQDESDAFMTLVCISSSRCQKQHIDIL